MIVNTGEDRRVGDVALKQANFSASWACFRVAGAQRR
jgi:hypothetical protein